MKAACRVGALVATLSAFWMHDALAQSTPDCIDGAVSIPLLGGKGDSPILPATLDGKEIALYFSSGFDVLYVGDMEGFDIDDTRRTHVIMTNREHSQSRPVIKAGTLTLGGLDLQTPDMIQLIDYPMQHIGTRPLIGTIGSTFFNRLALLLDMPHGVFGLIRFRQEAACSNAQAGFIGTGAQTLPLTGNDTIMGLIEGKERELSLDSDVPVTTLPERWLNRPAPGNSTNDAQHPTVALFGDLHSRLRGTTLKTFRIGQESLDNMPVFAQRDLGVGLLGVDFFQSHIVLFDYPNHRVFLLPARSQVTRPGQNLHFDRFREGQTSVKEKR